MGRSCCVKGCDSAKYPNSGFSLHCFPKNEELREKWLEALGCSEEKATCKNLYVCTKHFKKDDFRTTPMCKPRLNEHAVPSLEEESDTSEKDFKGSKEKQVPCEGCHMKFETTQAMLSHRNTKHPKLNREVSPAKDAQNSVDVAPRVSRRLQERKVMKEVFESSENSVSESSDGPSSGDQETVSFKCPRCNKIFSIFFKAFKHIQKNHCEDAEGNPVSPYSLDIIRPVRIEKCQTCLKLVDSSHKCSTASDEQKINTFFCLGCDGVFTGIATFHRHISNIHRDNVDSMFFKNSEEFELWKKKTETQVKMKYLTINNTLTQKFYSCNYVSPKNNINYTYLCPSVITAKEFRFGIQIHYNKNHYGHTCPEYKVPEEFANFLTNKSEVSSPSSGLYDVFIKDDDEDLYTKFTNLMNNIKDEAAKLSIPHLKKLFNTATKMQDYLKKHVPDDKEELPLPKKMTDDQITNALETKQASTRPKRKIATRADNNDAKRMNIGTEPKTENNENTKSEKVEKVDESPKLRSSKLHQNMMSPSFNDSYREFLGSTEQKEKKTSETNKNPKRKEVLKTKIGQFSPKKISPSAEANIQKTKTEAVSSPSIEEVNKKKTKTGQVSSKKVTPSTEENIQKTDTKVEVVSSPIIENTNKKTKTKVEVVSSPIIEETNKKTKTKVEVVSSPVIEDTNKKTKAKIVQLSSKKESPFIEETIQRTKSKLNRTSTNKRSSLTKDIKYEVIEQENDCNILVLKI